MCITGTTLPTTRPPPLSSSMISKSSMISNSQPVICAVFLFYWKRSVSVMVEGVTHCAEWLWSSSQNQSWKTPHECSFSRQHFTPFVEIYCYYLLSLSSCSLPKALFFFPACNAISFPFSHTQWIALYYTFSSHCLFKPNKCFFSQLLVSSFVFTVLTHFYSQHSLRRSL